MILKLDGRDKINSHSIANKVNELIDLLNSMTEETKKEEINGSDRKL